MQFKPKVIADGKIWIKCYWSQGHVGRIYYLFAIRTITP